MLIVGDGATMIYLFLITYFFIAIALYFGCAWLEGKGKLRGKLGSMVSDMMSSVGMPAIWAWPVLLIMFSLIYICMVMEKAYDIVKSIAGDK
jgi:hypothetical protein